MTEQNTMEMHGVKRYSNAEAREITRKCIEEALFQLLDQKPFNKISITEIVKRAGVSRTAFYAHYSSKEDVLQNLLEVSIQHILKIADADLRQKETWIHIFQWVQSHRRELDLLIRANMGEKILLEINREAVSNRDSVHSYEWLLWTGAVFNVVICWLEKEDPEPIEEMAELCEDIVTFRLGQEQDA